MNSERGTERQILSLLHRARRVRELQTDPLAGALCHATGEADAVAALARVLDAALPATNEATARLREAIAGVDFREATSNFQVARGMRVSRRQLQRWRALAVGAMARHVVQVLKVPVEERPRASHAAPASARPADDGAGRFKLERQAFVRSRDRGNAFEMQAIATNLIRLARDRRSSSVALGAQAEAAMHVGRIDEAASLLERTGRLVAGIGERHPPWLTVLRARHALAKRDAERAESLAAAAYTALDARDREAFRALETIADARLQLGAPWEPPDPGAIDAASPGGAAVALAYAAHLVRAQRYQAARTHAPYVALCESGYDGLAARAAAIWYESPPAGDDRAVVKLWRARAIAHLLRTQDRLLAGRLFVCPGAATVDRDDPLVDAVYERLCLVVPQMLGDGPQRRNGVSRLIWAILVQALHARYAAPPLDRAAAQVNADGSALAYYARAAADSIEAALGLVVDALGGDRTELHRAVEYAANVLRPGAPRVFTIPSAHAAC